jgi:hypothetical protein
MFPPVTPNTIRCGLVDAAEAPQAASAAVIAANVTILPIRRR